MLALTIITPSLYPFFIKPLAICRSASITISSKDKSDIYISSDFANYNYTNQDSKFYSNVKIKYDDKEITCDNFELSVSENLAVAYENVIFKNSGSIMKAKNIIVNISTKDIKINSNDKIEVFKN